MFSFVFSPFVILVISHFGFKGWIWVQVTSVPDLCIRFTIKIEEMDIFYSNGQSLLQMEFKINLTIVAKSKHQENKSV